MAVIEKQVDADETISDQPTKRYRLQSVGKKLLLLNLAVRSCWVSLFSEKATA